MLDFGKVRAIGAGAVDVVPVAVQDADTKEVLIVAYANREALDYTLTHGVAAFWSTSRNELWVKGASSGDSLRLVEVRVNCEQNSLLYLVHPQGAGACHTKDETGKARRSCFYRRAAGGPSKGGTGGGGGPVQLDFVSDTGDSWNGGEKDAPLSTPCETPKNRLQDNEPQ